MAVEPCFSGPGCYRIEVRGHLPKGWAHRFGAMRVSSVPGSEGETVTVLGGPVSDQAELSGILNTLHELHLTLLEVRVEKDSVQGSTPP